MLHLSSVPLMINKLWNCIYENYMGDVFLECLLLVNYIYSISVIACGYDY